jgi:hypothetical protein
MKVVLQQAKQAAIVEVLRLRVRRPRKEAGRKGVADAALRMTKLKREAISHFAKCEEGKPRKKVGYYRGISCSSSAG